MLICDEKNETMILESIITPIVSNDFWILDLEIKDFTLAPMIMLEETTCPSILIEVWGYNAILPANWNILVYDDETMQLDVVEISDLSSANFTALVYGPNYSFIKPAKIKTIDYKPTFKNVSPSLNKHQMLCHPIDPDSWIVISPSDGYSKYLRDKSVGDII